MDKYTVSSVWRVLTEGTDDLDELIDIQVGLDALPIQKRTFLVLLAQGQSGAYAMHESGLQKNQTRLKRDILRELTDLINGDEHDN